MRTRLPLICLATGLLALSAALTAQADYKSTVLADNPAGYWRLDALPPVINSYATNSGRAGKTLDGVISNFTREGLPGAINGDNNTAMQFIGTGSSRISVPYDLTLNQGGSFTFECWMNPATPKGNALALVVNRNGESGYTIYINGDGTFGFNISRGAAGGYWNSVLITNTAEVAAMVGKWTHIACVFDQSGGSTGFGVAHIYTNGVLAASNEIQNAPMVPNTGGPFVIGDRNFAGLLDEVAAYSVALTSAQLLSHYQAGTNGLGQYKDVILADNPDGYWRLDETAGFVPSPVIASNAIVGSDLQRGTYDLGSRLQQSGAIVASTDKSAHFDGLKIMQVPAGINSQKTPPFSVEFWAKPSIAYGGGTAQACVLASTDRDYGRSGWLFYQGGNGWSWWLGVNSSTTYSIQLDPTTPVYTTNWYHIVGTYDGTTARLYVNGVEALSKTGAFNQNLTKPLTIGGRYDYALGYQGLVDEVAVYPSVLTSAEVQAHYQNGTNAAPSQTYDSLVMAKAPQGYWRLNDQATAAYPGVPNSGWLGSAVDGTVVGSLALSTDTPLTGDSNPAVDFTAGGRIAIPFDPALNQTNVFSYEVWYKQSAGVGTSHRCPLWWRDEPVLGDTRGWVHYIVDNGNTFQSSDVFTTWNGLGSTNLFEQDQWQHLVSTFDGKTKQMYLNGVLIAVSTTAKLAVKPVNRAVTTISSASFPWIGNLDEAAIYTNALTVDRIQAHYVAARGVNPPAVAPTFAVNAAGVTNYEGATVTIPTILLGTAPFTYQWYKGATAVPGQTTATLTLASAKESDSGEYKLTVTNAGGSADSEVATVLVLKAPPTILSEPQPAIRLQGSTVSFTVSCGGSLPLNYQWKSNNVAIAGATSPTLILNNIQPSFAATYSVTVANTAGTVNSQEAALTVVPVSAGSLVSMVVAAQPTAYWRLNESSGTVAHDYVGGHDGTYELNVQLGKPGAILGDTDFSAEFAYGGVIVPYKTELNPYTTFSLEAWVKIDPSGAGAGTVRPILSSSTTYFGWAYGYILAVDASDAWSFTTGQKTSGFNTITGGAATNAGWNHVVCTFDDNTGDKRLYVNGQLLAQTTTATGTFAPNQLTPDNLPPYDQGIGWDTRNYTSFFGGLDEVAFYNYSLNPEQVAAHYGLGSTPSVTIGSSGDKVVITWSQGLLLQAPALTGPWTTNTQAVSPWTTSPGGTYQFFRAVVP